MQHWVEVLLNIECFVTAPLSLFISKIICLNNNSSRSSSKLKIIIVLLIWLCKLTTLSGNGRWSTWIINDWTNCDKFSCERLVEFRRYCTDPVPDLHALYCVGSDQYYNASQCTDHTCSKCHNQN